MTIDGIGRMHYYGSTVVSSEALPTEKECAYICEALLKNGVLKVKHGETFDGRHTFSWLIKAGEIDPNEFDLVGEDLV